MRQPFGLNDILCQPEEIIVLTIEKALLLKSVGIFANVPDDTLLDFATHLHVIELTQGTAIFEQGDFVNWLHVIAEGQVVFIDNANVRATFEKGDFFGEEALLCGKKYEVTAITSKPTRLYRLDQKILYKLMSERDDLTSCVLGYLCKMARGKLS